MYLMYWNIIRHFFHYHISKMENVIVHVSYVTMYICAACGFTKVFKWTEMQFHL